MMKQIYFTDVFPTAQTFIVAHDLAVQPFKLAIFNNKEKRVTPLAIIYQYLVAEFSNVPLRYNSGVFLNLFWTIYIEHYPGLYISQLAYIKNEYLELEKASARQHYMITIPEGKSLTENFSAITNSGQISNSETPFSLQNESLAHKEGSKSVMSFENKKSTTTNKDLYLNILKIANNAIKFGLKTFVSKFMGLGQKYYNINSFDQPDHSEVVIKFDSDTMKKIEGKWRVVGIKDE